MTKINEMKQGQRLTMPLLIKDIKNGTTSKGAPYLTLTLQDNTGVIDGKFWDIKDEDRQQVKVGQVVLLSFEVLDYNHNLQLRINHAEAMEQSQIAMDEYVIASGIPEAERKDELKRLVNSIRNEKERRLVLGMLKKVGEKYMTYPAASKIHHNWLGGLSEHSLSMAQMAEVICAHYPQLDHDLLITGALIHDVGKTAEMSGPVTTEYTLEGKLEGHISIANGWLSEVADEEGLADSEEAVLLHHMILSHHGHQEFGSPVVPMVQEAEVLFLIDNLDARMNILKQALAITDPGAFTQKIFALDNRMFYKPKNTK
ncbi:MAG: HD domain-containing protein [Erysipelotrichaceae bacterium]|nr:HD domain-containing protein [Erysipelotrichaceae bacterium]